MNLEISKKIVEQRLKVSNGVTRPMLLDGRNFVSMDRASMKYYQTAETTRFISSAAFLSKNALGSLAGNIFLTFQKTHIPAKIFVDEKAALQWLQKYKYLN